MSLRAQSGFTLVELLVALSIAALLLVLAVPVYTTWVADTQLLSSAQSVAEGVKVAQAEAIKRNTNVEFTISATGWTVQTPGGATLKTNVFKDGSYYPTLGKTPALSTTVTFNSLGMVETANAAPAPPVPLSAVGITMAQSTRPATGLRVEINFGRVRICDPYWTTVNAADPKAC